MTSPLTDVSHVCLHGWVNLPDGGQEYADFAFEEVDGYSVFLRSPTATGFDISDDRDFETYEAAREYAEQLKSVAEDDHIEEY